MSSPIYVNLEFKNIYSISTTTTTYFNVWRKWLSWLLRASVAKLNKALFTSFSSAKHVSTALVALCQSVYYQQGGLKQEINL